MRKVAIVGSAQNTRYMAPVSDPTWEVWAMPWDNVPGAARYFEPHSWFHRNHYGGPNYADTLRTITAPLYMREKHEDIPASVAYPLDAVAEVIGGAYLESTIAYMLGLAILERVDRIGVFGVDMRMDEEYAYQKANCEYLIGFARGAGIKVFVPVESALLKGSFKAGVYGLGQERV